MDLVHDDPLHRLQVVLDGAALENGLQGLGGGDEHVGRAVPHVAPLPLAGVAVADAEPDVKPVTPVRHPFQDVPVQGPEWRDVYDADARLPPAG